MKRSIIIFSTMVLFVSTIYADSSTIFVHARDVGVQLERTRYQKDDEGYLYGFFWDWTGKLFSSIESTKMSFLVYSPNFSERSVFEKRIYNMGGGKIGQEIILGSGSVDLVEYFNAGKYDWFVFKIDDGREKYEYAVRNTILFSFQNTVTKNKEYSGYVIKDFSSVERLTGNALATHLSSEVPELTMINGNTYYKNNLIQGGGDIYDDDYNKYIGWTVVISNEYYDIIEDDIQKQNSDLWSRAFDHEGNLWYMVFDKADLDQPKLLYVGRSWGYKASPQSAVCTSGGLRIRLRSTTDAFILGHLKNNERITILKTGEPSTIDGKTAPWYRIKTTDGLIGWVWGGFVKKLK